MQVITLKGEWLTNRQIVRRANGNGVIKHMQKQGHPRKRQTRTKTKNHDENTIAKRYKLPVAIVEAIKTAGPQHGSQGRALQLATEFLVRLPRPLKVDMPEGKGAAIVGQTYKLTPRTAELIDELVQQYGTRGAVLCACVRILDEKLRVSVAS